MMDWDIARYYREEARYYRRTGNQMLYDTGLKKRPMEWLQDKWRSIWHGTKARRAARWYGRMSK